MDLKEQKELTRKNLQRVLNELPLLAEKHPYIRDEFDMGTFGVYDNLKKENLNQCNTIGCLLGNASRIFEKEFTDDLFFCFVDTFDYKSFGQKFFPYLYGSCDYRNIKLSYLFSPNWSKTKFNKLEDALQRVKNLLANDLECNKFSFRTNKIIK